MSTLINIYDTNDTMRLIGQQDSGILTAEIFDGIYNVINASPGSPKPVPFNNVVNPFTYDSPGNVTVKSRRSAKYKGMVTADAISNH